MDEHSGRSRSSKPPFWKRAACLLAGIAAGLLCASALSRILGITPASAGRTLVGLARSIADDPKRIVPPLAGTLVALVVMRGIGRAWGFNGEDIY